MHSGVIDAPSDERTNSRLTRFLPQAPIPLFMSLTSLSLARSSGILIRVSTSHYLALERARPNQSPAQDDAATAGCQFCC